MKEVSEKKIEYLKTRTELAVSLTVRILILIPLVNNS